MPLSELQGQPRAAALLGAALAGGHVHHAYLFAGPAGVGKTLAARLVAQALNCESPQAQAAAERGAFVDDPCGVCGSCRRITDDPKRHAHPMVLWVDTEARMEAQGLYSPEGDRSAAKAIGVRLLRELVIPRVSLRALGGRRKVAVLHDVDFTEGAQNAFLKTLEEPPPDTTFILLSSTPDALKPTIRSRCARVTFQPLSQELVAAKVARERKVDPERAALLAAVAGGSIGGALEVDEKALETRRALLLGLERLAADDWLGWLSLAEAFSQKEDAAAALDSMESWYRDVAVSAATGEPPSTHLDLGAEVRAAAEKHGVPEALRRIEQVRTARQMLERHVQGRLVLEQLFLGFGGISPLALVEE